MKIRGERLQWGNPVDGYQYKIPASGDRPEGEAQLIYKRVSDTLPEVQSILSNHGLQPDDKIAHLNEFYPNGRGRDEEVGEHMREGVGTAALDFLIGQCISQGAKAIYVFSVTSSMQSFLSKKEFETFGPNNCHHVKILKAS